MDAEVVEHGIRLPAAKQLDGVGVYVGAEESGGAARPQGAGGDGVWWDAREVFHAGSGVS